MTLPPSYSTIKDYFEDALDFLISYHWLYSVPNTHVLVNKVFEQFPAEWLSYLKDVTNEQFKELSSGSMPGNPPQSLEQFCTKIHKLKPKPQQRVDSDLNNFQFAKNSGLSEKKKHEIICLAPLINEICDKTSCGLIIDVGTGLGYLPQLLHDRYNYRVVAIEGSPDKLKAAKTNQLKYPKSLGAIEYVEHFITDQSELKIREIVGTNAPKSCVTGLHACADLSVTILNLFTQLDFAKALVVMPCCYHRLKQNGDGFDNFPVSSVLKENMKKLDAGQYLNVAFLRLACQGVVLGDDLDKQANGWLFRAILQKVAFEENCEVRRLRRKSGKVEQSSFAAYLTGLSQTHCLVGGLDISGDGFVEKMQENWRENEGKLCLVKALTAFQTAIQSVCENVVLLDRVAMLMEKGVDCFVVRVTDRGISPRCHALVAVKP